jgi:catechol 2,3-dioxygenase-like lactoylglutathione lyase family enzyme
MRAAVALVLLMSCVREPVAVQPSSAMATFPKDDMELTRLLVVRDAAMSTAWYRDVLGAEVVREYGSSVVLKFLGSWFLLVTSGGPTEDKPTVSFAPPADPNTVSAEMIVRVDDCQAAYEELSGRGAEFLTPPVRWDHGEIRAFFRDPDGHLFEISELVK